MNAGSHHLGEGRPPLLRATLTRDTIRAWLERRRWFGAHAAGRFGRGVRCTRSAASPPTSVAAAVCGSLLGSVPMLTAAEARLLTTEE